jgi:hypothetical protein
MNIKYPEGGGVGKRDDRKKKNEERKLGWLGDDN